MGKEDGIQARIEARDVSLFGAISSQTTDSERESLLEVQAKMADAIGAYRYLEIGSHLGGSIQPHLMDVRCQAIISIDRRPEAQADEQRGECLYPENSTQRMLGLLEPLAPDQLGKIQCFDCDASNIDATLIANHPELMFVDGEHTDEAVVRDAAFCAQIAADESILLFHDSTIVSRGLRRVLKQVLDRRCSGAKKLKGSVMAFALGEANGRAARILGSIDGRNGVRFLFLCGLFDLYRKLSPSFAKRLVRPLARRVYKSETGQEAWPETGKGARRQGRK